MKYFMKYFRAKNSWNFTSVFMTKQNNVNVLTSAIETGRPIQIHSTALCWLKQLISPKFNSLLLKKNLDCGKEPAKDLMGAMGLVKRGLLNVTVRRIRPGKDPPTTLLQLLHNYQLPDCQLWRLYPYMVRTGVNSTSGRAISGSGLPAWAHQPVFRDEFPR